MQNTFFQQPKHYLRTLHVSNVSFFLSLGEMYAYFGRYCFWKGGQHESEQGKRGARSEPQAFPCGTGPGRVTEMREGNSQGEGVEGALLGIPNTG
jgi:hypothetical protein